jgi:predicted transcriptional regulator
MSDTDRGPELLTLTADIVAAFVSNNSIKSDALPRLIADTHAALARAAAPTPAAEPNEPAFTPAVSVRKSLGKREVILSMIDGKPYKTLRRHLSARGLTPEEYRARYKLPKDYPMVAPAYSELRRETAKRLGLSRKRKAAATSASRGAPAGAEGKVPAKRSRKAATKRS